MWFLIAFALSLTIPSNGILLSLFHGLFGRLYIIYFFIMYNETFFNFVDQIFSKLDWGV